MGPDVNDLLRQVATRLGALIHVGMFKNGLFLVRWQRHYSNGRASYERSVTGSDFAEILMMILDHEDVIDEAREKERRKHDGANR